MKNLLCLLTLIIVQSSFAQTIQPYESISANFQFLIDQCETENDCESELEKEKKLSAQYLAKMQNEQNATVLKEGVILKPIFTSSSLSFPKPKETLSFAYNLFDREEKLLEESFSKDLLHKAKMSKFLRCWQIALPKIPVGSMAKISCPSDTAWGDVGVPGHLKPGAAVTFRVFLAESVLIE